MAMGLFVPYLELSTWTAEPTAATVIGQREWERDRLPLGASHSAAFVIPSFHCIASRPTSSWRKVTNYQETDTMRLSPSIPLTLCLSLGLSTAAIGADRPRLHLADEGLPLQEIRPMDRHVIVLTLEGKWDKPAQFGVAHYVNVLFPNGRAYSHRVLDEGLARAGEIRVVLPEYQLIRNGLANGGKFTVVVSASKEVTAVDASEVISDPLEVTWPMDRPVVRRPPPTKHTPPAPIDAFPLGDEMPKMPPVKKLGPPEKITPPDKEEPPVKKDVPPAEKLPRPKPPAPEGSR
jgi:hypothetical protein